MRAPLSNRVAGPSPVTFPAGGARTPPVAVVQGEFRLSSEPDVTFSTILGSCIAACLWDAEAGIGGMNHFLLAEAQGATGAVVDIRYGVHAMELLINALIRAGAGRGRLKAKLFGGAQITRAGADIGRRNGDFARTFLKTEGIPCLAESMGGTQARRVLFHPVTGRARQMLLPEAEGTVSTPLPPPAPVQGEIQLF